MLLTALIVESCEIIEQFESSHNSFGCWRIHVIEVYKIVDTKFLEFENDGSEVATKNFGIGLFLELSFSGENRGQLNRRASRRKGELTSLTKSDSVYNRKHFPGLVRPARPAL